MKAISNLGLKVFKILLNIISTILIIIIVLNILILLSTKVLKEYPKFLDFTYFVSKSNDSTINIKSDELLIIDLKQEIEVGNIVVYKKGNDYEVGQLITKDDNSIIKSKTKEEAISKDAIVGKVSYKAPILGTIINIILKPISLIISIILLIITTVTSSFLKKKSPKENQNKPNFNQTW